MGVCEAQMQIYQVQISRYVLGRKPRDARGDMLSSYVGGGGGGTYANKRKDQEWFIYEEIEGEMWDNEKE